MPDEQPAGSAKRSLTVERKTGFVLLLVFAVLGLTLGVLQIRNTMLAPFALNSKIPVSLKDKVNDVDMLRYRDTDGDGLSDFDELYTYGTSPYLYDSFSYGMSDKEVVAKGLARCANAGKNCSDAGTPLGLTTTVAFPSSVENIPKDINQIVSDPAEIRSLLVQSGMKKEILDKLSDQELLSLVAQLMASSTLTTTTAP